MKQYQDITLSPEARAKALLAEMSIEEKMGQLIGYMPLQLNHYEDLETGYPGSAGGISTLAMRGFATTEEAVQFQHDLQKRVMEKSPHRIPAIFHMEGLCGAFFQGASSFPSGLGRASSWDPELEETIGRIVSRQERAMGITHTLAPVLDISRDSRMGRQGETYGEDPALAAALGAAFTRGLQTADEDGLRTEAVAKHFLGFHAGSAGIHGADTQISGRELREVYARPFQAAITEAGLKGIMPCYCSLNGEPVSASAAIMNDLLRGEMGFDGVVFSDYGAVSNAYEFQCVGESEAETGYRAMASGMDLEMPNPACYGPALTEWFRSGKADIAVLDRAAERVLTAKFRMGLFEHPFARSGEDLLCRLTQPGDAEACLHSARESIVLLKNDGALPLKNTKRIAVIGAQAATARIFFGGYTHLSMAEGLLAAVASMAGVKLPGVELPKDMKTLAGTPVQSDDSPAFEAVLKRQKPDARNLLEELCARLPETKITYARGFEVAGNDTSPFDEALRAAQNADVVLVTLGGKHGTSSIASMGEGVDGADIGLPFCQEEFLRQLQKLKKPVVGIHFNGRPISSDVADEVCSAILECWNPAEKGAQAIVDVLLGTVNPSGKMTVSTARCAGQIPVYYNHPNGSSWHQAGSVGFPTYVDCPHTPRYPFGFGLSYTTFDYAGLSVASGDKIAVSFNLSNTGSVSGTEIAQVYIRDEHASMTRPAQELAGFCRVELAPGETKTVHMEIDSSQLAFLDREMRWKVEHGTFAVLVGASSADIRLRGSFAIAEDRFIDGALRAFYALGKTE